MALTIMEAIGTLNGPSPSPSPTPSSNTFMVYIQYPGAKLTKTWNEIKEAFKAGKSVVLCNYKEDAELQDDYYYIGLTSVMKYKDQGVAHYVDGFGHTNTISISFTTPNPDDYPVLVD